LALAHSATATTIRDRAVDHRLHADIDGMTRTFVVACSGQPFDAADPGSDSARSASRGVDVVEAALPLVATTDEMAVARIAVVAIRAATVVLAHGLRAFMRDVLEVGLRSRQANHRKRSDDDAQQQSLPHHSLHLYCRSLGAREG